jgi:tRNA (guanine-N7-)-methyltransferase
MPHLHIEKFKEIKFPNNYQDISFNFICSNINHKEEKLISVTVQKDKFFLLVREDNDKILLKTDKLTRPASIYNVHRALLAYASLAELNVVSSNVPENKKNIHLEDVNALKRIEYFSTNFPKDKEVYIEVGFGSGRHLLHQALHNPDILFIGIEIHRPSIEQVLKQITIQKLDNILLLDYDARLFLELVPSNIVGKIFVHFPVPWDKKPHRRVISTSFIKESRRVLKMGGRLELRTDSENYYAYSYETFINFHKTVLHISKNKDIAISSKYEDRWKKLQKNIYDVVMINEELSDNVELKGKFVFNIKNIDTKHILSLHNQTKKFDNGFIHFERIYTKQDGMLVRVSMGSFDRPEHLYIILDNNSVYYYPQNPLKSRANLNAHKYLEELLNG